jgi:hypothetical protein
MDPLTHKRYLDYRARHSYFAGQNIPLLSGDDFAKCDAEFLALEEKGDTRDDEEEARFGELLRLLLRD